MRVLHIGKYYPPFAGGMENFLGDLLPALDHCNVTSSALVHAHSWQPEGRVGTSIVTDSKIRIIRAPTWGRFLYAPISPLFPHWLHKTIQDFKPDILHIHMPNTSGFWALKEPLAATIPWVIHWHSDVVASAHNWRLALAYPLYRPLEQSLLSRADKILVTSPPYLASSAALTPWRNKCHILPLGIDTNRFGAPDLLVRQAASSLWMANNFHILAIGRLTYYKGHEILIKAVAKIPNAQLLIIGKGEYRNKLEHLVKKLNLTDRVDLLGYLPELVLQGLLASCDCLCLPSIERTEAFGLVLLEAMRYARPIISSDVSGSGMGWVVEQQSTGILVPPGDVDAWVKAIQELAASSALCHRLGNAGKARLKKIFAIQPIAQELTNIYDKLLT